MNAANLMLCGLLFSCHHGSETPAAGPRWPGQDPATTHAEAVLVGDSIVAFWPRAGALNHGIGGQTMGSVAENLIGDALAYNPRVLLIEGGINDFLHGASLDAVVQARLKALRLAQMAGRRVYMMNLTPFDAANPSCAPLVAAEAALTRYNAVVAAACADGTRCVLVDAYAALGSAYRAELYRPGDCLHPSPAGYALLDVAFNRALGLMGGR